MRCSEQRVSSSSSPSEQQRALRGEGPRATRCTHELVWFWPCGICTEGAAKGKTARGSSHAKEKHKRRKLSSQVWVPVLTGEVRVESSVGSQGCALSLGVQVLLPVWGWMDITGLPCSSLHSAFPPAHPVWSLCICKTNSVDINVWWGLSLGYSVLPRFK